MIRIALLIAVAMSCVLATLFLPAIAQPAEYHRFADSRHWAGIDNFWNVATNLPFLAVGIAGLRLLAALPAGLGFDDSRERRAYAFLFIGLVLTFAGSSFYHLAPDNTRLAWDRLPMTIVFMSMLAAMIAERMNLNAGIRLLTPLVAIGIGSVLWWKLSEFRGAEDLRPYLCVQYGSILIVALIAALFPPAISMAAASGS